MAALISGIWTVPKIPRHMHANTHVHGQRAGHSDTSVGTAEIYQVWRYQRAVDVDTSCAGFSSCGGRP